MKKLEKWCFSQVTNQEIVLHAKDQELQAIKDKLEKMESEHRENQSKIDQVRLFFIFY